MLEHLQFAAVLASPIFAAGGAYYAVKVHLAWLRRDVDDVRAQLAGAIAETTRAHLRIDSLVNLESLSTQKLLALAKLRA
jgi:outer membrane murein-binding lipoprotein Lpp